MVNKKILLGVCGGIAAYKAQELARVLTHMGASVKVVLTASANKFVSPVTFKALTGNDVHTDLFDSEAYLAMGHIELARWADIIIIVPATANILAKMANGIADDLLSTIYLVTHAKILVCPAMNHAMWHHRATMENCNKLRDRGVIFVGPTEGTLACNEKGMGKLANIEDIINAVVLSGIVNLLKGHKVIITAGPTIEPIDPVRYITNHSSGKMGYALACALSLAGAKVTLISGPVSLNEPLNVDVIKVNTADEMLNAVIENLNNITIFIGTSAVCDYRVNKIAKHKIKKNNDNINLGLIKNPDILTSVRALKNDIYMVGFAAETQNLIENAKIKLNRKKLDMIIANFVGENKVFGQDENEITIITQDKVIHLPLMQKLVLAGEIVNLVSKNLIREKVCEV